MVQGVCLHAVAAVECIGAQVVLQLAAAANQCDSVDEMHSYWLCCPGLDHPRLMLPVQQTP